jgi:two-component system phosphate regulon sensor histidine kinase PhoR
MKRTIFLKLFAAFFIVVSGLSALVLAYSFQTIRDRWIARETARLEGLAKVLARQVRPLLAAERQTELDALVNRAGADAAVRVTVVNPEGRVLADSVADARTMENHRYRPEILEALAGRTGVSLRRSPTIKQDMLYVCVAVGEDGRAPASVLRVSLYLRDIDHLIAALRARIIRLAAAVIAVLLAGALLFARHISRPVHDLTAASRRVADGDFKVKVYVRNRDELKALAESFNAMTLRLRTLFEETDAQKDELNQVIGSIREALMVIGPDDRILLTNRSCWSLCRLEDVAGKYFWEVIRHPGFQEIAARVKQTQQSAVEEIVVNDRSYLASVVWVPARSRRIVTFLDLTEVRDLERIKKDFVTNLSHELRTPLTAIKGFAETLDPGNGEANRRAVEIIRKNTDRLIAVVQDLVVLSALEEKGAPLDREPVALAGLLEGLVKGFEPRARDKGIALELKAESDLPTISADPFRLEQLFQNLLDNALKYTDKGRVEVTVRRDGRFLAVDVRDTGIGIPEEHLPHIFERFYIVDKSRDKRLGGTGLGLSIAKHIALRHAGSIEVQSRLGAGTTFTVRLPLAA